MLRGLLGLTWLEIKIFVREPLGVIGTVGIPVLVFVLWAACRPARGRSVAERAALRRRSTCRSSRRS